MQVKLQEIFHNFDQTASIFRIQKLVCNFFVKKTKEYLESIEYQFYKRLRTNCVYIDTDTAKKNRNIIMDSQNIMRKQFDQTNKQRRGARLLAGEETRRT